MARLTPIYAGMSHARLDDRCGLHWPCPDAEHPGTPMLHRDALHARAGPAHAGRGHPPAELPDAEYPLQLTTFRLHLQYGCGSMTRRAPLLERENPRGLLWIHPPMPPRTGDRARDAGARAFAARRAGDARACVSEQVPPGVVAMPYHFGEAPSNLLTNDALDPISRMPELKVCAVRWRALP